MGYLSPASTSRLPSVGAQEPRKVEAHDDPSRPSHTPPSKNVPPGVLCFYLVLLLPPRPHLSLGLRSTSSARPTPSNRSSVLHPWLHHQLSSSPTSPRPRSRPDTATVTTGSFSQGGSTCRSSGPASSPLSLCGFCRAGSSPPSRKPRSRRPRRPRRSPRSTASRSASGKYLAPRRRRQSRKGKRRRRSRGPTRPRSCWPSTAARTWLPRSRSPSSPSPPATSSSTPASTSSSCSPRLGSRRTRPGARSGHSRWPTPRTRRPRR